MLCRRTAPFFPFNAPPPRSTQHPDPTRLQMHLYFSASVAELWKTNHTTKTLLRQMLFFHRTWITLCRRPLGCCACLCVSVPECPFSYPLYLPVVIPFTCMLAPTHLKHRSNLLLALWQPGFLDQRFVQRDCVACSDLHANVPQEENLVALMPSSPFPFVSAQRALQWVMYRANGVGNCASRHLGTWEKKKVVVQFHWFGCSHLYYMNWL